MILGTGNKYQGSGDRGQGSEKLKLTPDPCPLNPDLSPEKAFTLIEVMLTITILAVGIIGVLRAYAVSINVMKIGQYSIDSLCLLKQKIAEIEQEAIEKETLLPGVDGGRFKGRYKDFEWKSQVKELYFLDIQTEEEGEPIELKPDLNEVKVTVTNEHAMPVRKFSLVTYVE